jgi:ribosomal-protein-alanine N-acetyltransferase
MGYLSSGLKYVIDLAFESLKLHRLEADIQPGNDPSKRMIKRAGFRCEGVSPQFIRINDEWIDHERWALTLDEWLMVSRRYS